MNSPKHQQTMLWRQTHNNHTPQHDQKDVAGRESFYTWGWAELTRLRWGGTGEEDQDNQQRDASPPSPLFHSPASLLQTISYYPSVSLLFNCYLLFPPPPLLVNDLSVLQLFPLFFLQLLLFPPSVYYSSELDSLCVREVSKFFMWIATSRSH